MKSRNLIDESIKLQLEAKALGLDWIELNKIISKIREETDELEEAIGIENKDHIKEELGDLFFTLLCLSRHLEECPEEILASANKKFESRYTKVLNHLNKMDKNYADPKEMEQIWQIIKKQV